MTTASGVAVVATQVARTDRRALSEAWYSALHLARGEQARPLMPARRAVGTAIVHRPARALAPPHGEARPVTQAQHPRASRVATVRADGQTERRRPACAAARRIERAVTELATQRNGHAAQTIEIDGGRVRVLVRVDRGTTRIIAVCSAPLREPVERALAQARFALAGGGAAVAF